MFFRYRDIPIRKKCFKEKTDIIRILYVAETRVIIISMDNYWGEYHIRIKIV